MDNRAPLTKQQYLDELNCRLRECDGITSEVAFAFDPPGATHETATGVRAYGTVDEEILLFMSGIVETAADEYRVTDPGEGMSKSTTAPCKPCESLDRVPSSAEPHKAQSRTGWEIQFSPVFNRVEIYKCEDCNSVMTRLVDPQDEHAIWWL